MYKLLPYAFILLLCYSDAYLQETKGEKLKKRDTPLEFKPGKLSSMNSVKFNPYNKTLIIYTNVDIEFYAYSYGWTCPELPEGGEARGKSYVTLTINRTEALLGW